MSKRATSSHSGTINLPYFTKLVIIVNQIITKIITFNKCLIFKEVKTIKCIYQQLHLPRPSPLISL